MSEIFDLLADTIGAIIDALREHPKLRFWLMLISSALVLVLLSLFWSVDILFVDYVAQTLDRFIPIALYSVIFLVVVSALSYSPVRIRGGSKRRIEYDNDRIAKAESRVEEALCAKIGETTLPRKLESSII
jgi:hypothetical protein